MISGRTGVTQGQGHAPPWGPTAGPDPPRDGECPLFASSGVFSEGASTATWAITEHLRRPNSIAKDEPRPYRFHLAHMKMNALLSEYRVYSTTDRLTFEQGFSYTPVSTLREAGAAWDPKEARRRKILVFASSLKRGTTLFED